jgi:formate/nitrite transporter FocA (FNT family)
MLELFALDCNWLGFARNPIPSASGNLAGGAGIVGLVYWVINRRETITA